MKKISRNEQLVLYGLAKYPTMGDNEICKAIDMKQSTFSTIKKKLRNNDYYKNCEFSVSHRTLLLIMILVNPTRIILLFQRGVIDIHHHNDHRKIPKVIQGSFSTPGGSRSTNRQI